MGLYGRFKKMCMSLASHLILSFRDEQAEKEYEKYKESQLDQVNKRNLFVSLTLFLISAFTIILRKLILRIDQNLVFDVLNLIILVLNIFSTSYSLIKINRYDLFKRKISTFNFLCGINFFSLCIVFFLVYTLIKLNTENIELFASIVSLASCCSILFVFTFCYNFMTILISGSLSFILEIILINFCLTFQTPFIYLALGLNFFTCFFISYLNESKEKSSFLLLQNKETEISPLHTELAQPNYYKVLCDNLKYSIITFAKSSKVEFLNKSMCKIIKTYQAENYQFIHSEKDMENVPTTNICNYKILQNNIKKEELSSKDKNSTVIYIQNILSKLTSVNEGLLQYNKDLYEYLTNIRVSNLKKQNGENQEFILEEFMKVIQKDDESEVKTLGVIDQSKIVSNNLFTKNAEKKDNNTINNVNTETILKENSVFLNVVGQAKQKIKYERCFELNSENDCNYILLGKITIESIPINIGVKPKKKEYPVYLIQMTKYKEMTLLIEDNHQIIKRERKETAKVCKSLYLSKVSHEFKNPICNLQELISSLKDELQTLGLIKRHKSPNFDNSFTIKVDSPLASDHESYFSGGVSLIKEKETSENKPLANCVNNLKCTTDMMLQILKDFTFYTKMIDDLEEIQTSSHPYERRGSFVNRSQASSPAYERSPGTSFFQVNNKECQYKEVILNVLNIFVAKSILDCRQSKLTFDVKFHGKLPDLIEIETEHFQSLIFNTLYHLYKNVNSGKVEIVISIIPLSVNLNNSSNCKKTQIQFEVFVYGVANVKELTENIISDTEESKRSKKKEEIRYKENKTDAKHRNLSASFFVEHFHLKHIFSLSDNSIRNKFIDNFNKNFHYYLIQIYSKRLGLNMNFDTSKKGELKIYFCIENKLPHTLSKLKSKNYITSFQTNDSSNTVSPILKKRNSLQNSDQNAISKLIGRRRNTIGFSSTFFSRHHNSPSDKFKKLEYFEKIEEVVEDTKRTKINECQMNFDYSLYMSTNLEVKKMFKSNLGEDFILGNCISLIEEESSNKTDTIMSIKENQDSLQYTNKTEGSKPCPPLRKLSSNPSPQEKSISKLRKRLSEIVIPTNIEKLNEQQFTYTKQRDTLRKSESSSNSSRISSKNPKAEINKPNIISQVREDLNEDVIRVLLCDDENLIRKTLHRFLNMMTKDDPSLIFDVQHSKDGFDCLHKVYENYNLGQYFDVLIIDETMPLAKGSQVINFLKTSMKENDLKNFVIASFTSYNSPDKIDFIYSQGADIVLSKPIDYNDFKKFFQQLPRRNEY